MIDTGVSSYEKITLITNWKLEKELRRLFRLKFETRRELSEGDREWTQVFPETLEDIRFKEEPTVEVFPEYIDEEYYDFVTLEELKTITETVSKLKKWLDIITNGKNLLRDIGKYLIIIGIIILIGAISYAIFHEIFLIVIFIYIATPVVYKLHGNARAYRRILTEIDEAYKKVQKRSMDL